MQRLAAAAARIPETASFALALILRLAFAAALGHRLYQIDEGAFDAAARSLAASGTLGPTPTVLAPLPPLFFSLFYRLASTPLAPRLAQAALGALFVLLLGRAVRDISRSEAAGRIAAALAAIYPFYVYYCGMLMSETLYLFFSVAGLWAFCRLLRGGGRMLDALGAGGGLAAAALCRTEAAPIAVLVFAAAAGFCARRLLSRRLWAAALFAWLLPLSLWCARNRAETGRFTLDTHGGITLLHGTLLFEHNEIDTEEAMRIFRQTPLYQATRGLPEADQDAAFRRAAFEHMLENPRRTLGQWARKSVSFWRFYPRVDKAYAQSPTSKPDMGLGRWALVAVSLLFEPWLILLGAFGFWARGRKAEWLPLWLFVLATMGIHVLSVSQMRYRLAVTPWLMLACATMATSAPGARESPGPSGAHQERKRSW